MSGDNRLVTENFLRLNFSPKSGVTPGTNDLLSMDCDQIASRYNVNISGVTTTGKRCPSQNQISGAIEITPDTQIFIYFDSSGSMSETLQPLLDMRNGNLKDALLPMYNNDITLYNNMVIVPSNSSEAPFRVLNNLNHAWPSGKIIIMMFTDEASYNYHSNVHEPPTSSYLTDISGLRSSLSMFANDYYRGIIFQVATTGPWNNTMYFKPFLQAVQNGTGSYAGENGLSDKSEIGFEYDVIPSVAYATDPTYYLNLILQKLRGLGYAV
jgi:hypothetical protein